MKTLFNTLNLWLLMHFVVNLVLQHFHNTKNFLVFKCISNNLDTHWHTSATLYVIVETLSPGVIVIVRVTLLTWQYSGHWHHTRWIAENVPDS